MKKISPSYIASNGIVCALYVVLTFLLYPLSYNVIQFRISEILILLVFFRRDYAFGLVLGCVLTNLFSPLGMFDVLFGTMATLFSCFFIMIVKQLALASLFPVIFNAFLVGYELYWLLSEPFWLSVLWVFIGEFIVLVIGYIIFMMVGKRKSFQTMIKANRNLTFKF